MKTLIALSSLFLLAACASMGILTATTACTTGQSANCYTVWYATNRKPVDAADYGKGFTEATDDAVHYGKLTMPVTVAVAGITPEHAVQRRVTGRAQLIYPGGRLDYGDASEWERGVRGVLSSLDVKERDVVVFIHGYANTFDQTAQVAANLGATLQIPGVMVFFSWPSRGWQDPLNYLSDLTAVENTEEELAGFLARLSRVAGPGRVHIIAHSLGAHGLLRALHSAAARAQILEPALRFGQIILAAPDMDERLFRRLVAVVPSLADRTTLYVSDEDMAVYASEILHGDHRIGLFPPIPIVVGVDTIEVIGRRSRVELGHSYFRDAPDVFRDIQTLIHYGESPLQRELRNGFPIPDDASRSSAWVIPNRR